MTASTVCRLLNSSRLTRRRRARTTQKKGRLRESSWTRSASPTSSTGALASWARHSITFALKLNFTQWEHDEIEIFTDGGREAGTKFDQQQFVYRGSVEQSKLGPLTGRFGFWGLVRDYKVAGEEALSPPVDQNAFAVFGLEELEFRTSQAPVRRPAGADQLSTESPGGRRTYICIPEAHIHRRFRGGRCKHRPMARRRLVGQLCPFLPRTGSGGALQPRSSRRHPLL